MKIYRCEVCWKLYAMLPDVEAHSGTWWCECTGAIRYVGAAVLSGKETT